MIQILLTIDYEIFGNGTGNIKSHMIEPAESLMRLGERFNIPITFFIEVEEYLAFKRYAYKFKRKLGYDPEEIIRKQIIEIINRGHDVQLHIHPQWKNAYWENNTWILDQNATNIDSLFNKENEAVQYIHERKSVLEKIIGSVEPGRKICAFRAGAFCAQPGKLLIPALKQNGIVYESSVVKGLYRAEGQGAFDYRLTPNLNTWRIVDDVAVEDQSGVVTEMPIGSLMQWRFQQLTYRRIKAKFSRKVPKEKQKETLQEIGVSKNPLSVIKFLFKKAPTKFDIHNVEAKTLLNFIKKACSSSDDQQTITLIGHTKEHVSDTNVEHFFRLLKNNDNFRTVTFNDLLSN